MNKQKRRIAAWVLLAALLLALTPGKGQAVLEDVYFSAVNDQLLELDSDTMPFYSGGAWYISSRMFQNTDLGVSYANNAGKAILYTNKSDLRFDLKNQTVSDKQGVPYSGHAIDRGGSIFFPVGLICRYFGLRWSVTETETAPLLRVTSSSAILNDSDFIDAASSQMRSRYMEYEKAMTPPQEEDPVAPLPLPPLVTPDPEDPPPVQAAEGQKVFLLVDSQSAEDTLAVLECLDGIQATFLLTLEDLEDADRVRALVAGGHEIALQAIGETEGAVESEIEQARTLLWQAACCWLELVWYEGRADLSDLLADAGAVRIAAEVSWRPSRQSAAAQSTALLRSIGRYREDVPVYLGRDGACLELLPHLRADLEEAQYRLCAWRLAASDR